MESQDTFPLLKDERVYHNTPDINIGSESSIADFNATDSTSSRHRKSGQSWWNRRAIAVHGLVFSLYTSIFVISLIVLSSQIDPTKPQKQMIYYGAIKYQRKVVDGLVTDNIMGERPSELSNQAWHDLMKGINLKITNEEMELLGGPKSLKMADGSGYLATLGAYHELHCIKRLRKYFYRDYFYPNMTWEEDQERFTHAEHCLELMRQSAICHGDVSITTFEWLGSGQHIQPTTREGTVHQCVDWGAFSNWAESRAVNLFDPDLLERPSRNQTFAPETDN